MEAALIAPTAPGLHAIVVMLLVVVALVLFASERIPLATSSLLILVFLSLFLKFFLIELSMAFYAPAIFLLVLGTRRWSQFVR